MGLSSGRRVANNLLEVETIRFGDRIDRGSRNRRALDPSTLSAIRDYLLQLRRAPDREEVRPEESRVGPFRVGAVEWQDVCARLGDGRGVERVFRHVMPACADSRASSHRAPYHGSAYVARVETHQIVRRRRGPAQTQGLFVDATRTGLAGRYSWKAERAWVQRSQTTSNESIWCRRRATETRKSASRWKIPSSHRHQRDLEVGARYNTIR